MGRVKGSAKNACSAPKKNQGRQQQQVDTASRDLKGCSTPSAKGCSIGRPVAADEEGVLMLCTNAACPYKDVPLHRRCFDHYESELLVILSQSGSARNWNDRQLRCNLWQNKGYDIVGRYCKCICGKGNVRPPESFVVAERKEMHGPAEVTLDGQRKAKAPKKKKDLPTVNVLGNSKQASIQAKLDEVEEDHGREMFSHLHSRGGSIRGGGESSIAGGRTRTETSYSSHSLTSTTSNQVGAMGNNNQLRYADVYGDDLSYDQHQNEFEQDDDDMGTPTPPNNQTHAQYQRSGRRRSVGQESHGRGVSATGTSHSTKNGGRVTPPISPIKETDVFEPAPQPKPQTISYAGATKKETDKPTVAQLTRPKLSNMTAAPPPSLSNVQQIQRKMGTFSLKDGGVDEDPEFRALMAPLGKVQPSPLFVDTPPSTSPDSTQETATRSRNPSLAAASPGVLGASTNFFPPGLPLPHAAASTYAPGGTDPEAFLQATQATTNPLYNAYTNRQLTPPDQWPEWGGLWRGNTFELGSTFWHGRVFPRRAPCVFRN